MTWEQQMFLRRIRMLPETPRMPPRICIPVTPFGNPPKQGDLVELVGE